MNDPLLTEIRRIREQNARAHAYDAHAMARDFIERQNHAGRALAAPRKKPAMRGKHIRMPVHS